MLASTSLNPAYSNRFHPNEESLSNERYFQFSLDCGKLGGFTLSDYWFDIGNSSDYRKANFALTEKIAKKSRVQFARSTVAKNSKLIPPLLVGRNTHVDSEAKLGPNAVLGKNVFVGKRVRISNSIIFDNVKIGERSTITGAIVATDATIGKGVKIESGAIISPKVSISDGVKVGRGAIIHPYKEITQHIRARAQVM